MQEVSWKTSSSLLSLLVFFSLHIFRFHLADVEQVGLVLPTPGCLRVAIELTMCIERFRNFQWLLSNEHQTTVQRAARQLNLVVDFSG